MKIWLILYMATLLAVAKLGAADQASMHVAPDSTAMQHVPASDPRFRYEGRFDFTDRRAPVMVWAGSRISLDFEGTKLALSEGVANGQNFFNITVDDVTEIAAMPAGGSGRFEWPHPLAEGRHRLIIYKRSEAMAGDVQFKGIEIGANCQAWVPAPVAYRLRMQFIGDSITVGACNEDGPKDQWENRRTHNHEFSYATLTSAAFNADHRAMAVSGMGIITGFVPVKAHEVWDRIYPRLNAPKADLVSWQPNVVLINLGENDDAYTGDQHQPFPANFTEGYVSLVQSVRAAWPEARIVLLRGGMHGGAKSVPLSKAWTAAVGQLEAADPAISHFVFSHWSSNHPRVPDDRAMADELVTWLKAQPFMQKLK